MKHDTRLVSPTRVHVGEIVAHWTIRTVGPHSDPVRLDVRRFPPFNGEAPVYRACSRHPDLKGKVWTDRTLDGLEHAIRRDLAVQDAALVKDTPTAAFILRSRGGSHLSDSECHVGFDLAISAVPRSATSRDPALSLLHGQGDQDKVDLPVVLDGDEATVSAVQRLAGTLHLFGKHLTESLACNGERGDPPTPQALVEMMSAAAEAVEGHMLQG